MQREKFVQDITQRFNRRLEVNAKKSKDYATEDVLSNFKRVGAVVEIMRIYQLPGPLAYCFTLIILKLDRWINLLISKQPPQNESIDDTVLDLQNYIDLTDAVSKDQLVADVRD